jgi:hypothetical protein
MSVTGAKKSLPHGTVNGYNNWGCRCEECHQAQRDYYGHKPMAEHLAEVEPEHGTEGRYTSRKWACRCDLCREAANDARRERRQYPNVRRHGLHSSYGSGCRCDDCRAAHTVYTQKNRARKRRAKAAA